MENVAGEQGLAIRQDSYTTLLILFKFQTVKIISFFNGGGLTLKQKLQPLILSKVGHVMA